MKFAAAGLFEVGASTDWVCLLCDLPWLSNT